MVLHFDQHKELIVNQVQAQPYGIRLFLLGSFGAFFDEVNRNRFEFKRVSIARNAQASVQIRLDISCEN